LSFVGIVPEIARFGLFFKLGEFYGFVINVKETSGV
jgi:hypothetical protein